MGKQTKPFPSNLVCDHCGIRHMPDDRKFRCNSCGEKFCVVVPQTSSTIRCPNCNSDKVVGIVNLAESMAAIGITFDEIEQVTEADEPLWHGGRYQTEESEDEIDPLRAKAEREDWEG